MKTLIIGMMLLLAQIAAQPPASKLPAEDDYAVGAGDVLAITVFGEPNYSRPDVPIDNDGTIEVPDLGRLKVVGKTTRQIQQMIASQYVERAILLRPNVAVTVKEFRSQTVWVTGQVRNPSSIPLRGDLSLPAAIQAAGGFANDAGLEIHIFRARPGDSASAPAEPDRQPDQIVSREDFDAGRAAGIRLRDADTVRVPSAPKFYVAGFVKTPGEYVLRPGLTVFDAVMSLAGGLDQYAAKNRIEVTRTVNGRPQTFKPKDLMTEPVQAGDRIYVPRRRI